MIKIKTRYKKLLKPNLPNMDDLCKKYGVDKIIKLNYNENRFGATPKLYKEIKITNSASYPNYENPELSSLIEKKYNIDKKCIFLSNGSDAILDAIPELFTYVTKNENVILPEVTFKRIEQTCIIKNIGIKKIPLKDGYIDLENTLKAIDEKTSLLYIVNPNMPTGTYHGFKELVEFLKKVPSHVLVVLDEAYTEYSIGIEQCRINDKKIIEQFDNVIILHTFSKLYALAAFRVGYAISRPYIINVFKKATQYLPLSTFAANAAKIACDDDKYYSTIIAIIKNELMYYEKEFTRLNIKFIKSQGNFIYIEWSHKNGNTDLWEYLIKNYGVLIRRVGTVGFRITVGTHEENKIVISGIEEYLLCTK